MKVRKLGRREFLRVAGLGSAAAVVAACQPETVVETVVKEVEKVVKETVIVEGEEKVVEKVVKETVIVEKEAEESAGGFQGEIEFYAQAYTPTSVLVNPDPDAPKRYAMQVLADAWNDLHPGVELKCIPAPTGDYHAWLDTQLLGGTGPDVFWKWLGSLGTFADQGKVVPLNDYLELPNKYTPEDDTAWKNTFKNPFLDSYSPKGLWGGIPLDLVSTGIYANVDMLAEVGVDLSTEIDSELGSPTSWAVWMDWHEALKDAGYMAFCPGWHGVHEWWYWGIMTGMLCRSWADFMDVLNYFDDRPLEFQEGVVSTEEVNHAYWCMDWKPFDNPQALEVWRLFAEWVPYFAEGWATRDTDAQYQAWAGGEAAFWWDGSWAIANIQQDDMREFEFTSFWLPQVTKETSEFASDPPFLPIGVGGYGSLSYGINHKCIDKGNVEECVDWLMWISTPEHDEMIVNEQPSFIPSNKKAKALPEVENMFVGETRLVAGGTHPVSNMFGWFGDSQQRWGDTLKRNIELFGLGEQTLDETIAEIEAQVPVMAPEFLREAAIQYSDTGSWDLTQWECQPEV
jgi:raffinose/stachyose/melibiose transport system substrate-binding protein